ncbi:hypothetical protein BABINDRAFT_8138 [Babjeviella inositovora NRRL Y-12698]|uniref:N-(5'-phosphoribosyl)anthranilate isomerase n=1 Tax=Babjeviella inositovora NRRL Y-12698 TaxID=984486 RepID=A0A1E3QQJ2_9ASCO|nr:uncharacterized protein BABINDRAFT_8138 [Babjeviella inositovora NRRL Y-12698]ODQ79951.1 hypothetical protein BABINDRAFT_8138 [Babjeviella inositovora NRRL Y-12698]
MASLPLVKICGLQSVEAAQVALDSGADLLGIILVPGRSRTIDTAVAQQIAQLVQRKRRKNAVASTKLIKTVNATYDENADPDHVYFQTIAQALIHNGPYLVGVVQNQTIGLINKLAITIGLDFIQIHGKESRSRASIAQYVVPVISRVVLTNDNLADLQREQTLVEDNHLNLSLACTPRNHALVLMDSEVGGEGKTIDWSSCARFYELSKTKYILAGGLTPDNVQAALEENSAGVLGVDVSGGVETDGKKDMRKIRQFVENAKAWGK